MQKHGSNIQSKLMGLVEGLVIIFPMWETHLFAILNFELHVRKMANHAMA